MDSVTRPKIDTAVCPLCGQPNNCAMAADPSATQCWCGDLKFPQELMDQVPENVIHQTCICRNCFDRFMIERKGGG